MSSLLSYQHNHSDLFVFVVKTLKAVPKGMNEYLRLHTKCS